MTLQARYRTANPLDLARIKAFLNANELPELGVDQWVQNFVIAEGQDGSWLGIAGLETYGESGLLRSVAVDKSQRGQGIGSELVQIAAANAKAHGAAKLYLLTDDAGQFFERLGFQLVERDEVDNAVKASVEFTQICRSATVMRKSLSPGK
jgi:amino-acid N-acetyltransferase